MESAADALGGLCRRLFTSQESFEFHEIPGRVLNDFLHRLEQSQAGASVTRRSAGLALFVGKIVASQPEKSQTKVILIESQLVNAFRLLLD